MKSPQTGVLTRGTRETWWCRVACRIGCSWAGGAAIWLGSCSRDRSWHDRTPRRERRDHPCRLDHTLPDLQSAARQLVPRCHVPDRGIERARSGATALGRAAPVDRVSVFYSLARYGRVGRECAISPSRCCCPWQQWNMRSILIIDIGQCSVVRRKLCVVEAKCHYCRKAPHA